MSCKDGFSLQINSSKTIQISLPWPNYVFSKMLQFEGNVHSHKTNGFNSKCFYMNIFISNPFGV